MELRGEGRIIIAEFERTVGGGVGVYALSKLYFT